jgi:alcohol dehydrogenase, propanol-preferring
MFILWKIKGSGMNGQSMCAMILQAPGKPLQESLIPRPTPGAGEVLLQVLACGVCRTDLHICDGELDRPKLPLVPGHEIVGRVVGLGPGVDQFQVGDRVGVPWLGRTCGACQYCLSGQENLCDAPDFNGYTRDGGYAEYALADQHFCFHLPPNFGDAEAAPLLCAGLIGYRSYRLAGGAEIEKLGIYGFGAAAHLIAQVAVGRGQQVYAFTTPGDIPRQQFARRLGTAWVGGSDQKPPVELDAALIFAPVGGLVPAALQAVRKGGVVVCGGIHMSDIPSFPYRLLWEERVVRSVANLTRQDGIEFLDLIRQHQLDVSIICYPLNRANAALEDLRRGRIEGAAVLIP